MIASLKGELSYKTEHGVIVDVNGVGYEVFLSQNNMGRLPVLGEELFLHVYTNVREDDISLYGFIDVIEKKMFLLLVSVSGVGPKVALNILSGAGTQDLAGAICAKDLARLTRLPGIGKKTAERICLELADKVDFIPSGDMAAQTAQIAAPEAGIFADAVSALMNLGYPPASARDAVDRVKKQAEADKNENMPLEEILRQALRSLA